MRVSTSRYRDWNSLPESVRATLIHNQLLLSFEELYKPSNQRTEPSYELLFNWCVENCTSIWSTEKISYESFRFSFWAVEDQARFVEFLQSPRGS